MKRIIDPDKLYYDVTIDHDPQHKEHRFEVSSKAETTIDLVNLLLRILATTCFQSQSLKLTQSAFLS